MSGFLEQAKAAASSAVETATNLATQAANTTSNLASQAYNSQTAANLGETTKTFGTQAYNTAGGLVGAAHEQAHALAPNVIPKPSGTVVGGVDGSSDLEPQSPKDRAKLERLFEQRSSPAELKEKGILKGAPGDALAGRRAELEKSMLGDRLDKDIAQRPTAEELVKKGILNPDEAPSS